MKTLLIILSAILLFSCKKEDEKPNTYLYVIAYANCTFTINDSCYNMQEAKSIKLNTDAYFYDILSNTSTRFSFVSENRVIYDSITAGEKRTFKLIDKTIYELK